MKSTMKPLKNKAHRHKYEKVVEWITSPSSPEDLHRYWCFTVKRSCECGTTQNGPAEQDEVEKFINDSSCSSCGTMGHKHPTQSDCIRDLHNRVRFMEERLEKVCDALSGIGR